MVELTIPYWEVVLRLVLASLLCGAIGFERETRDQPAGFRTHILLGLGAALFTLVSAYGFEPFTRAALGGGGLQFDPTRIAAQIIAGVGFLGAGAIIGQGCEGPDHRREPLGNERYRYGRRRRLSLRRGGGNGPHYSHTLRPAR